MSADHDTASSRDASGDEFYIGWEETAPPSYGRRARGASVVLLVLAPVLALVLASARMPFDASFFDFGTITSHQGVIHLLPHPVLMTDDAEPLYLVAFGKHGADDRVAGLDGQRVHVEGTLIHRAEGRMLELAEGGVQVVDEGRPGDLDPDATVSFGRHTLRGEIVDAKCWLGVMKPGAGKTHRACASLCIRGGIPPLFVARHGQTTRQLLLVGDDGRAVNLEVLEYVAEGVEITGEVVRTGDQWTLRADLDSLRRLHGS